MLGRCPDFIEGQLVFDLDGKEVFERRHRGNRCDVGRMVMAMGEVGAGPGLRRSRVGLSCLGVAAVVRMRRFGRNHVASEAQSVCESLLSEEKRSEE